MLRPLLNQVYVSAIYPAFERQNCLGLGRRLARLRRFEELSLAENQELQRAALARIVKHACETSPFYRERFEAAGVQASDAFSQDDLAKVPMLTREEIRNNLDRIRSQDYQPEQLLKAATGGTTDTPVPIWRSLESVREKVAVQWRFNQWAGYSPGDKVFYLWGARQDFKENPSWRWRLYDRTLMRRVWAPTSLFNRDVLESYRKLLNEFRPRAIFAYPTPLALFCEYLLESRQPHHRPQTAICTAEKLLPGQRAVIEKVLGCRVFDHYGSRELGMFAAECEKHDGMHVNPHLAYVEYLPVEGATVEGLHEIVVTDLMNYGAPLIRYRTNDCAVIAPDDKACSCGRGYPRVREILSRTTEVFLLPNGDRVPGVALTNRVLQACPGLRKTQVIQEELDSFLVRYVPGPGFSASDLDLLRTNLKRFFSTDVRWTFEEVADIEREKSGKTRFCISRVAGGGPHPEVARETPGTGVRH